MSLKIKLAISPCPNDTFIFEPMIHQRIDSEGLSFDVEFHDVETLNRMALKKKAEMIKVSYHAWLFLREHYFLLDSGSAMGEGNGPLLISREPWSINDIPNLTVAVPGEYTTAHLLLRLMAPNPAKKVFMVFSDIETAVLSGKTDAGAIIHENRFTYKQKGLLKIADLGGLWETLSQSPIPLGGIVVNKTLGDDNHQKLNRVMHRSVRYSMQHPEIPMPFVREHAQEMEESVMKQHIGLYVNHYTLNLGEHGKRAIHLLVEKAEKSGLLSQVIR